ncbi:MAG: secretin N-terminal domain-containing protein, partial [Parachlamydiales bacterium]
EMHKFPIITRIFPIKNKNTDAVAAIIKPMISTDAVLELLPLERQIIVTDISTNIAKIADLIQSLDSSENPLVIETYNVLANTTNTLITLTTQIMAPLIAGNPFILVPQDSTRTIYLVTTPALAKKTVSILQSLDSPAQLELKTHDNQQIFIYKPVNLSNVDLQNALEDLSIILKKEGSSYYSLTEAIDNMKWIAEVYSFLFTSTNQTIEKLQKIIQAFDSATDKKMGSPSYFLYKLNFISGEQLEEDLDSFAKNLKSQKMYDYKLLQIIESAKWIKETNSILLSGDPSAIEEAKNIISQYDTTKGSLTKSNFFIYNPKFVSLDAISNYLNDVSKDLINSGYSDPNLINAISSMKLESNTNAIIFTGDEKSLEKIKDLLNSYDVQSISKGNFFIYNPKFVSIEDIEQYLKHMEENLTNSGLSDPDFLNAINSMKAVNETNSIVFTGNEQTLEKIKNIIASYDVAKAGQRKGNFLMYSPKNVSLEDLKEAVTDVSENLSSSGFADRPLLDALNSMRLTPSTNSAIFTGDSLSLDKIQTLLTSIGQPLAKQAIQHIGKLNFWIYKIKNAKPQHLLSSIKSITTDLAKLDTSDQNFLNSLKSVRYVSETNSLIFTGTQDSLEKIEPLIEKFDLASEGGAATVYFVYKPKYLKGPELQKVMQDFAENLKVTNLENPYLFEAIESMKFTEQTNTMVFTGTSAAIDEIKQLLVVFDIPETGQPQIQEITGLEDLGFLVYKLQYHKGSDIQQALKQISVEIKASGGEAAAKMSIVKAIESIQWLQITNSLLISGDKDTLTKIKELIGNLDVPLKQVFIEVLVIQTTLGNALTFGLDWASKFQYKNQAAMGIGNIAPTENNSANPFATTMNTINATRTPQANSDIPLNAGFDLGIIGDILLHKGKSFLSLGSLLNALQNDSETSIVMTPKIVAQDGITATIFSGQNVPYTGSVITNTGPNTIATTNIEYRDIGMSLTITPILGNSDAVTLSIDLESTNQPGDQNTVVLGTVTGITTTKTSMNTSVHVANKNFLVLSGMVTDIKRKSKSGIPCLGGIPIIGAAFSKNNTQEAKNNIVIFLRPHIINSYKDMQALTQIQEDSFREQAGTPALERDFDEATDLIK